MPSHYADYVSFIISCKKVVDCIIHCMVMKGAGKCLLYSGRQLSCIQIMVIDLGIEAIGI